MRCGTCGWWKRWRWKECGINVELTEILRVKMLYDVWKEVGGGVSGQVES